MTHAPYQPAERRPISSRDMRSAQAIAHWLASRRVSPNLISILGLVASVLAGLAFWSTDLFPEYARLGWLGGAAMVQLRLLANMFDGMVAIALGRASRVGELYNEVPDRISDSATLIGFGYAASSSPTAGYLAALAAIFTAYVRVMAKVAGGPQDYCGPMAKPQRMFWITMAAAYLAATPTAWHPTWGTWSIPGATLLVIFIGASITSARRLARVANFLKRAE